MRSIAGLSIVVLVGCRLPGATIIMPIEPEPEPAEQASLPEPRVEIPPTSDVDRDHDGHPDEADKCPDDAETYQGTADADGCPDEPSRVRPSADGRQIELLEPVQWIEPLTGKLALDQPVLDDLFALLGAVPELCVEIGAHDSPREDLYGMSPTDRQAKTIADWLVNRGIDTKRLTWEGWGETRPIADNATAEGRKANQRIEVWVRPC